MLPSLPSYGKTMPNFAADDYSFIRARLEELRKAERNPTTATADLYCAACGAKDAADMNGKCGGQCIPQ